MANVSWTDQQRKVLEHRGGSLLVSAAAGSGKTAVLVERLIRRICDATDGADIDSFLIVTFTSAAAAEMKTKIYAAISERLSQDPSNRRLRRQLTMLPNAQINTVHAFCQSLLREHFESLSLSPDFRIADEFETNALKETVLNTLIEEAYSDGDPAFLRFVDVLSAARNDRRMVSVVTETYEKLRSHPFPQKWAAQQLTELERACHSDPAETVFGKTILTHALNTLQPLKTSYRSAMEQIQDDPALSKGYLPAFEADLAAMEQLDIQLHSGSWDDIVSYLTMITFVDLKPVRNCDKQTKEALKALRETWKKLVVSLQDKYFTVTAAEAQEDFRITFPLARTLFDLVERFETAYSEAKRRKNILDFSDLEHFTVDLLVKESANGTVTPTELAHTLSQRYTEVMVDEYQDTNEVQDSIFKAISKHESNLFMVGDIKQSIYRFRLADPMIFRSKYASYAEDAAEGQPRKIILSKNFRSRPEVLDSVNFIFKSVMSDELGDLNYTPTEYLYHGAPYPETQTDLSTEFLFVETGDSDESAAKLEAEQVARRIRCMIENGDLITDSRTKTLRPVTYGDVVILLRSQTAKSVVYANALSALGIPCRSEASEPLLDTIECSTAISFLTVIDNAANDLALVSVMRSPMYRFTTDELASIRAASKDSSYPEAVSRYAANGEMTVLKEKCAKLLTDINDLRIRVANMTVGRLLWHLYDRMNFLAYYGAFPDGLQRQTNLIALFDLAGRFEKIGYKGLYAFIRFLERLRENGSSEKISVPKSADAKAVTIMSIHKSKGLEFPVVIIPDCAKSFNMQDLTVPVLLHAKLGVGFKAREAERRVEYPTLARQAIALQTRKETLSEELRILYVAMTRAKEKLILSANVKDQTAYLEKLRKALAFSELTPALLTSENSILPWIIYPLLGSRGDPSTEDSGLWWRIDTVQPEPVSTVSVETEKVQVETNELPKEYASILTQMQSYVYPHPDAANTPSKATATGLKGRYLDSEANLDAVSVPQKKAVKTLRKPKFLSQDALTPTERGIAHHLVMQFMDFSKADSVDSIRDEIRRLFAGGFLTKAQADAVEPQTILAFFQSVLGQKLRTADHVYRELKFSLLTSPEAINALLAGTPLDPAHENIDPADKILLQGVIDCYFETDGQLTLIDFKTDLYRPGAEQQIAQKYRPQLACYAYALKRMTGKPVSEKHLYLFHGDTDLCL